MIDQEIAQALHELLQVKPLSKNQLCVFGISTSEVVGHPIGTSGSEQVAERLFQGILRVQKPHSFQLAFQCCEHLNRACVVEQVTAEQFGLTEVSAIPIPHAGGAMASYAYQHLSSPVCVETIQADAGVDLGDTLIGMHLKPVAVPLRTMKKTIGKAHLTMAYARPKYIGGSRAIYLQEEKGSQPC